MQSLSLSLWALGDPDQPQPFWLSHASTVHLTLQNNPLYQLCKKITQLTVFEKPVAESLPDEASGGDLSGKKSAKEKKKKEKKMKSNVQRKSCVGRYHHGTVKHQDETLNILCRVSLRSSFLSTSLAAEESQKND